MADKIVKRPDTPLAATPEPNFSLTSRFSKVKNAQDKNEKADNTPASKTAITSAAINLAINALIIATNASLKF